MLRNLVFSTILASAALTGCVTDQDSAVAGATITSADELATYLQTTPDSPLDRLSPGAKQRFLDSLVFSDDGLGGYSYVELQAELSPTEIFDILSLFGAEHTTSMIQNARINSEHDKAIMMMRPPGGGDDYADMKCSARATCSPSLHDICMSSC